jgi:hypothetical protein
MYKIENENFEFEINGKVHSVDPWPVYKKLYLEEDITVYLEDAESDSLSQEERRAATDKALGLIRSALELDEESLSSGQCVQVMYAFIEFIEEAKKKQHGWLTLLQMLAWDSFQAQEESPTEKDLESQSSEAGSGI